MRVLVTGPRDWPSPHQVRKVLSDLYDVTNKTFELVHGACPTGVDAFADAWGRELGDVWVESYPAHLFGKWPQCGPIRNEHMVSLGADLCVAFVAPCTRQWCRKPQPHNSHGTENCIKFADAALIPVERIALAA